MKYALLFVALLASVWLIQPPDSVRDAGSEENQVSDALMLEVPVCYSNGNIKLGQTTGEVFDQLEQRPEETFENGKLIWKWKQRNSQVGADTLVTCTFDKQRLVAVDAITLLDESRATKKELLEAITADMLCLQEVSDVLLEGKNLSYSEEELSVQQEIKLLKVDEQFKGLRYCIKYSNNEINS